MGTVKIYLKRSAIIPQDYPLLPRLDAAQWCSRRGGLVRGTAGGGCSSSAFPATCAVVAPRLLARRTPSVSMKGAQAYRAHAARRLIRDALTAFGLVRDALTASGQHIA